MGQEPLDNVFMDPTAVISKTAKIGKGTEVWAFVQVGDNARIGQNCILGNGVYVDRDVTIGNNVVIHNKALVYRGVLIEDNCFIGPGVCFTNDKYPKFNTIRDLKENCWIVKKGTTIGANATILPDVNIGENVTVGAGSVVTISVPDNVVVCGNPARILKKS